MLDAEIISAMSITDEQKRTLALGDVADALRESPAWRLILDWGEQRCNQRLVTMRKARNADGAMKLALQDRWDADEQFLQDLQVFVGGLIADRDALVETYSRIVHDTKARYGESGLTDASSFPNQGIEGDAKTNG